MDDVCNNFGPLFNSNLDKITKQFNYLKGFCFANKIVRPVLQVGPTCGFAALSNALKINNLNSPKLNELVELARSEGITNFGEIFSVDYLINFIQKYWPNLNPKIAKLSEMENDDIFIIKHFLKKREKNDDKIPTILIPYDCDKGNFEPCKRNGLGAHWAILTGFLLFCNVKKEEKSDESNFIIKMINFVDSDDFLTEANLNEKYFLYLIGYQGKSSHPAIWSFSSLFQSNAQLNISTECQQNKNNNFCLPPEGINKALKGKCLLLN